MNKVKTLARSVSAIEAAIVDLQRQHARTYESIETLREMLEERREELARAREEQP